MSGIFSGIGEKKLIPHGRGGRTQFAVSKDLPDHNCLPSITTVGLRKEQRVTPYQSTFSFRSHQSHWLLFISGEPDNDEFNGRPLTTYIDLHLEAA